MFLHRKSVRSVLVAKTVALSLFASPLIAEACTRVVYQGANDDVITARSMD